MIIYVIFLIRSIVKKKTISYHIILILFFLYIHMLFVTVFYPIPTSEKGIEWYRTIQSPYYNIVPFKDIIFFIMWPIREPYTLSSSLKNLLGNIIAFAPFGFLFPLLNKYFIHFKKLIWLSFLTPLGVEIIQLSGSLAMRAVWKFADIDDVILNMTGMIIGFLILKLFLKCTKRWLGLDLLEQINNPKSMNAIKNTPV